MTDAATETSAETAGASIVEIQERQRSFIASFLEILKEPRTFWTKWRGTRLLREGDVKKIRVFLEDARIHRVERLIGAVERAECLLKCYTEFPPSFYNWDGRHVLREHAQLLVASFYQHANDLMRRNMLTYILSQKLGRVNIELVDDMYAYGFKLRLMDAKNEQAHRAHNAERKHRETLSAAEERRMAEVRDDDEEQPTPSQGIADGRSWVSRPAMKGPVRKQRKKWKQRAS